MEQKKEISFPNIKQSWGIIGMSFIFTILFIPIMALESLLGKGFAFFIYYILVMGATLYFSHTSRKTKGESKYNLSFSTIKISLLSILGLITLQTGIIEPIISLLPFPDFMQKLIMELQEKKGVFLFLAIVFAAPILEEFIFRGIILNGLLKKYSPTKAIVFSSFLFGLIHLNPWQFIGAFIIGLFTGWVYYKTGKLTLAILIHFINNFAASIGMFFTDSDGVLEMSLTEYYGGSLNAILIIGGAITIFLLSLYLLKNEFNKTTSLIWLPNEIEVIEKIIE